MAHEQTHADQLDALAEALETTGQTVNQTYGILLDLQHPRAYACVIGCIGLHTLGREHFGVHPGNWRAVQIGQASPVLEQEGGWLVATGELPGRLARRFGFTILTVREILTDLNDTWHWSFTDMAGMLRAAAQAWREAPEPNL